MNIFNISRRTTLALALLAGLPAAQTFAATDTPTLSLTGRVFRFRADDDATSFRIQDFDVEAVPLPVPGSLALSALGLFGLLAAGRSRRR